jgi:hypothetical protein
MMDELFEGEDLGGEDERRIAECEDMRTLVMPLFCREEKSTAQVGLIEKGVRGVGRGDTE